MPPKKTPPGDEGFKTALRRGRFSTKPLSQDMTHKAGCRSVPRRKARRAQKDLINDLRK